MSRVVRGWVGPKMMIGDLNRVLEEKDKLSKKKNIGFPECARFFDKILH